MKFGKGGAASPLMGVKPPKIKGPTIPKPKKPSLKGMSRLKGLKGK
jgi:hypothetical protein